MLDHVSIPVSDLGRAAAFYDAVLATLGYRRRLERPGAIGYGPDPVAAPGFWILETQGKRAVPGPGLHLSFRAASAERVRAFYDEAIARGARDAGEPGPRPQYLGDYYAFVFDPDGHKIEATFRAAS